MLLTQVIYNFYTSYLKKIHQIKFNTTKHNMDQRMLNAAHSGDIQLLHKLLEENPFLLSDYVLNNSNENPLTIAIKANQLAFARETIKQLAMVLNQDGTRPLDVASAYGHVEIVKEIFALGPDSCRLKGRDGRTAIHYAAVNGNVEIIRELMSTCSDCVKDVTVFGETALHLAVKYFKFDALESLLQCLEELDMIELVNWKDKDGNTVLHYAALRKQLESVELLIEWSKKTGNKLEVNTMNGKGLTAVDIVDLLIESSTDVHLREVLRRSGATSASDLLVISEHPTHINTGLYGEKPKKWKDIVKHFEFNWQRDSPSEARGTLLLVVTLIATVTFEAGISPPDHIFETFNQSNITISRNGTRDVNAENALNQFQRSSGELSTLVSITVFLFANSVALSTALSIVDYLTTGLPFQRELRVSMVAMAFAYGWSMQSTRPTGLVKEVLLSVALSMPLLLRFLPLLICRGRGRRN